MLLTFALMSALEQPAWAVDLGGLVEAWTQQIDGSIQGPDAALGTAIDSSGRIVVVGYLSREAGRGTDGYAVGYEANGTIAWEIVDDAGLVGPDRTSSEDILYDVAIDPLYDYLSLCGSRGMGDIEDPDRRYLLGAYALDYYGIPALSWPELAYIDGQALTSPIQECRGTDWTAGYVYAAGWGVHDTDAGRWVSWKFDEFNGAVAIAPLYYEYSPYIAVPDQALDISVNTATGEFAIVGTRGFAGLEGSLLNDTDWHVRYHDANGTLLWEDTLAGTSQLEDRAVAVLAEVATGDVYVVGYENRGTDNGDGADYDWVVIRYDGNGDGAGGPERIWTQTWTSTAGASEQARSLALDEFGDLLVGGYSVDAATGRQQWRIAKLASYDGTTLQSWLGPVWGGDARIEGIDFRLGKIAMVGTISNGVHTDFAAGIIEGDSDDDGVADSVDACPADPDKSLDEGICGCNVPDVDTDADGFENCLEECDSDPDKQDPGICGCGDPDIDTDGDLTYDCDDDCPDDPEKIAWGICGCGSPDTDTDSDGVLGCNDACSNTPPNTPVDSFGCPLDDGITPTGDTGDALPTDGDDAKGCGCSQTAGPLGGNLLGLAGIFGIVLARIGSRRTLLRQ